METMIANGISLIDFLYYAVVFLLSFVLFFAQRQNPTSWNRGLYRLWMGLFLLQCGLAYLFQRPLATRIYITLLLFSSVFVQIALWRRGAGGAHVAK